MAGAPNVWTQMNYVPPRGHCNFKQSVLSPRCPCLRFMLHPLKSSSTYECDGCAHHASFHNMENRHEDEITKRWEQEAKEKAEREAETQQRPNKRVRAIEYNPFSGSVGQDEADALLGHTAGNGKVKAKGRAAVAAKKPGRAAGARARGRLAEMAEEEDDSVVELD